MAETIRGINVVIGADTTKLGKALADVNKRSKDLQTELRQVDRLLKFDPGNTDLLAQKQKLLADAVANTSQKLDQLRNVQQQIADQFARGEISEGQYRAFQREVAKTEQDLRRLQDRLQATEQEQQRLASATRQLETLLNVTGKSIDDFADDLGIGLVDAIKSGRASADQLDEAIGRIGQAALGTKADLEKLKATLDSVDDSSSIANIRKELQRLPKDAETAKDSIKDIGVELENVIGGIIAEEGISGAVEKALDVSDLKTKIDITFDVPASSKKSIENVIRTIEAYGVDAESALEGVRRQWALNKNASDEANAAVVKGAAAIASAYADIDFTELIQETNEVAKHLNISNQDALALIHSLLKTGFPPDQLDIISEYGDQLHRAGFNAQQIQAIFAAGIDTKTWNIDNLIDGLKEGRIRLAEFGQSVPKATQQLLKGTGISAKQLQQWGRDVAAGGQKGQRAMSEVAKALNNVKDKTTQNALGVQIFGTMWEDQGQNILDTLINAQKGTESLKDDQKQLNDTVKKLDSSPAVKMKKAMQDVKTAAEPLLDVIANVISHIANWIQNNPTLAATIVSVVSAIGILMGILTALAPIFMAIATAAGVMGVSIGAIAAPVAIIVAAIAGLIAIGILLWKNWDTIKAKAIEIWGAIKSFLSNSWNAIKNVASSVWGSIKSFLSNTWGSIKSIASSVWNSIKSAISSAVNKTKSIVSSVWNSIKGASSSAWNGIKGIISSVWRAIKSVVSSSVGKVKGFVVNMVNGIKSTVAKVKDFLTSPFKKAFDFIKSIPGKIKSLFTSLKIHIPMPHFKFGTGHKKIAGINIPYPKIDIDWYKTGAIFNGPQVIGVGEAGPEAVVPLDKLPGIIADALGRTLASQQPAYPIGPQKVVVQIGGYEATGFIKYVTQEQARLQSIQNKFRGW